MLAGGCNSHEIAPLALVKGTVLLDGKALDSGRVIATPAHGRGASGEIDSNGQFSLTTPGLGEGAVVGTHQVAIVAFKSASSGVVNPEAGVELTIPHRYTDPSSSGLTIDVRPDQLNEVTFSLSSKTDPQGREPSRISN